ncbi:MAG TPA: hypothetical protein VFG05_11025 [Methylocella sp.]|nr:hypothetical protein [Methylocella sp.]
MAMPARACKFLLFALTEALAATKLALNRHAAATSIQMISFEAALAVDAMEVVRPGLS